MARLAIDDRSVYSSERVTIDRTLAVRWTHWTVCFARRRMQDSPHGSASAFRFASAPAHPVVLLGRPCVSAVACAGLQPCRHVLENRLSRRDDVRRIPGSVADGMHEASKASSDLPAEHRIVWLRDRAHEAPRGISTNGHSTLSCRAGCVPTDVPQLRVDAWIERTRPTNPRYRTR